MIIPIPTAINAIKKLNSTVLDSILQLYLSAFLSLRAFFEAGQAEELGLMKQEYFYITIRSSGLLFKI